MNQGLLTVNRNGLDVPDMKIIKISTVEDVPKEDNKTHYLTFTVSDKDALRSRGIQKVNTINEFQGS